MKTANPVVRAGRKEYPRFLLGFRDPQYGILLLGYMNAPRGGNRQPLASSTATGSSPPGKRPTLPTLPILRPEVGEQIAQQIQSTYTTLPTLPTF